MSKFKPLLSVLVLGVSLIALPARADSNNRLVQCWKDGIRSPGCVSLMGDLADGLNMMFDWNLFNGNQDSNDTVPNQVLRRLRENDPFARAQPGEWPHDGERTTSVAKMINDNSRKETLTALNNTQPADSPDGARGTGL